MKNPRKWQLTMIIENLTWPTTAPLPYGYSLRYFQSGDEKAWERIILEAFNRPRNFSKTIASDDYFLPQRVLFVCHREAGPVATACAWHAPDTPDHVGYLYMVGALEAHRGKGLGYTVCVAALRQMVRDSKTSAMLVTDSSRLAAIKTYLRLGFLPKPLHGNHPLVWKNVLRQLGMANQ